MSKAQFLKDNLKPGEVYAGLILGQDGAADYHLVLLPARDNKTMPWQQAMDFAKQAGGDLPNRRELRLLWVNAKQHFKDDWYWSSEQHAADSDCAWCQGFYDGGQVSYGKGGTLRARAVRRLEI